MTNPVGKYHRYRKRSLTRKHALIATAWWITGWRWLLRMHIDRLYAHEGIA